MSVILEICDSPALAAVAEKEAEKEPKSCCEMKRIYCEAVIIILLAMLLALVFTRKEVDWALLQYKRL